MLSGGGARGFAHAGAVAGLEELGYDAAIVVGTSMGAIVGALYAAGYSSPDIVALIEGEDWRELFATIPRTVGPRLGWRRPVLTLGTSRPPFLLHGLLDSHRIDRALLHLLFDAGVRARNDFDELPRRFRAITADLEDGAELAIGTGDLPRAVRASMAVPGAFAPVVWGDRVLVDGGIANNLPISVARELGATSVIAVDVLRPTRPPTGNPLDIAVRALRLTLANAMPETPPPDVLVVPALADGFNEVAFPRDASRLVRIGRAAGLLAPRPSTTEHGRRPPAAPPDSIHAVEIESPDPRLIALARHAFRDVAPAPYRPEAVLAAVDRLLAGSPARAVWPRVERRGSRNILVAEILPEPDLQVAAAAAWSLDVEASAWAESRVRLPGSWTPALSLAATAGAIERSGALALRVHPPPSAPLALIAGIGAARTRLRVFDGNDPVDRIEVDRHGGWLAAEWQRFSPDAGAVLALHADRIDRRRDGAPPAWSSGPVFRIGRTGPAVRVIGTETLLEAELRRGDIAYERFRAAGSLPLEAGRLRTAILADLAVTSRDAPPDVLPDLGGDDGLPGLREQRYLAPVRALTGADLAWPIPFEGDLRLRLRAGASSPRLAELQDIRWIAGAGIGAVLWTVVGPMTAEFGATTRGDRRLTLSAGHQF